MSMKMEEVKSPYEISLWDFVMDENGDLKERKLAVIGSDTMIAKSRAIDPVFTKNINGTKTLTFKMYTQYFDEFEQKNVDNPFVKLMVVERIVKLYYKGKWYDLVIKKRQESSDKKTYSFTASDLHINELSKNGFNLEFKTELRNNQGTVLDLGEQIVSGTLWSIDRENSDIIRAYVDEQLYSFKFLSDTVCLDMLTGEQIIIPAGKYGYIFYSSVKTNDIEKQIIYSDKYNLENNLYDIKVTDDGVILLDEENSNSIHNLIFFNEDNIIGDIKIASYRGKKLVKKPLTKYNPILDRYVNIYQDNTLRYVEGYTKTEYLSPTFVENLIINGENIKSTDGWSLALQEENDKTSTCEVYTYPPIESTLSNGSSNTINLNYKNYLKFVLYNLDSYDNLGFISNYLKIGRIQKGDKFTILYRFKTKGQLDGDNYIKSQFINFQFYNDSNPELPDVLASFSDIQNIKFNGRNLCKVTATFNYDLSEEDVQHLHFLLFRNPKVVSSNQYDDYYKTEFYLEELQVFREIYADKYYTGKKDSNFFLNGKLSGAEEIAENLSINQNDKVVKDIDLINKVTEILENAGAGVTEEDYYYDDNNNLVLKNAQLFPGEVPVSGSIERKFFYSPTDNLSAKTEKDYKYLDNDESLYVQLYNDKDHIDLFGEGVYRKFEKITSIEQAESNRFNLIQGLCEKFQCWADFVIEHDSKGFILSRKIRFKEYIGIKKFSGFKYGINLKSIQRTIDSNQIVTKTIVKPNNNKFAQNGFCTITRADDNLLKQNYILDFSYYINQGLISEQALFKDLYIDFNGYKKLDGITSAGYYELMLERGQKRNALSDNLVGLLSSELKVKSNTTVLKEGVTNAKTAYLKALKNYKTFLNVDYPQMPTVEKTEEETNDEWEARNAAFQETTRSNSKFIELCAAIENSANNIVNLEAELVIYNQYNEEFFTEERKKINRQIEDLEIEKIQQDFFNKYGLFLHEGTWTSENYYDDNLYYIDALDVSRTSAKPKINYTINVIDVSSLEEFKPYSFDIGDKTFIEDTEFFGWVYSKNGIKTPYKEEVVIIETAEHLNNLSANQIKVQNYKTQFDDLFQRIAASTQTLTYASGGYQKAANVVASGQIDPNYFQNTLESNSISLKNGSNENVLWDESGITVHDGTSKNKFVRLTGEGLKISDDGGRTWSTAITGNGINAEYISTGVLDAGRINIVTNGSQTFSWDKNGITAFAWEEGKNGIEIQDNFVRLDQYGLYHISDGNSFTVSSNEKEALSQIKQKAIDGESNFALLRDGSLYLGRFSLDRNGLNSKKFSEENSKNKTDDGSKDYGIMLMGIATPTKNQYLNLLNLLDVEEGIYKKASRRYKNLVKNYESFFENSLAFYKYHVKESDNDTNSQSLSFFGCPAGLYTDNFVTKEIRFYNEEAIIKNYNDEDIDIDSTIEGKEALDVATVMQNLIDVNDETRKKLYTGIKPGVLSGEWSIDTLISDGTVIKSGNITLGNNKKLYFGNSYLSYNSYIYGGNKSDGTAETGRDGQYFRIYGTDKEYTEFKNYASGIEIKPSRATLNNDRPSILMQIKANNDETLDENESYGKLYGIWQLANKLCFGNSFLSSYGNINLAGGYLISDGTKIENGNITFANGKKIIGGNASSETTDQYFRIYGSSEHYYQFNNYISAIEIKPSYDALSDNSLFPGILMQIKKDTSATKPDSNNTYGQLHGNWFVTGNFSIDGSLTLGGTTLSAGDFTLGTNKKIYFGSSYLSQAGNIVLVSGKQMTVDGTTIGGDITLGENKKLYFGSSFLSQTGNISIAGYLTSSTNYVTVNSDKILKVYQLCGSTSNTSTGAVVVYGCNDTQSNLSSNNGIGKIVLRPTSTTSGASLTLLYDASSSTVVNQGELAGTWVLSGSLTSSGTTISSGNIALASGKTLTSGGTELKSGNITLGSSKQLNFGSSSLNQSGNITLAGTLTSGGTIINGDITLGNNKQLNFGKSFLSYSGNMAVDGYLRGNNDGTADKTFKILGSKLSGSSFSTYKSTVEIKTNDSSFSGSNPGIRIQYSYNNSSNTWGKLYGTWTLNGATIATTSDYNRKNSIKDFSQEYSTLFDNLKPVIYKYNDGTSNRFHTGFIAQEVKEAINISSLTTQDFAAFVVANEENEETGEIEQTCYLRYEEFIALNTNEIQKLKARVTQLETELEQLKLSFNS